LHPASSLSFPSSNRRLYWIEVPYPNFYKPIGADFSTGKGAIVAGMHASGRQPPPAFIVRCGMNSTGERRRAGASFGQFSLTLP
jgi:hypothetical protein